MDSPTSSSDPSAQAFAQLHPRVQRWIYRRGWQTLRGIQVRAIAPIVAGRDLIITATTAGGKTEAAFLPIVSRLADEPGGSVRCLQVSPLKALINDQFERLTDLCEAVEVPVWRWHGDVNQAAKQRLRRNPSGILLITPESLESLHTNHGRELSRLFGSLAYVVVDELHAFIGTERGRQLQSLLHRLELALGRRVPRVGLSATLGDMALAAEFLRPADASEVEVVQSTGGTRPAQVVVHGYRHTAERPANLAVVNDLYQTLRGADHLAFANSRQAVEEYADALVQRCQHDHLPNCFHAHHGNLAKGEREDVEAALRAQHQHVTVFATSTLELGIDIGSVKSVAQIGCPPSVASLRQRMGRSGRQDDEPHLLRVYAIEDEVTPATAPPSALRIHLVQTLAMMQLMGAPLRWCEPPEPHRLHLSTLVHQVLALIAEHSGVYAQEAFATLCAGGPFAAVTASDFACLLRSMGASHLITQDSTGLLLAGDEGERIINHYSFYTVFETPLEWRVMAPGRELGSVSLRTVLTPGAFLILAARRWRVTAVDEEHRVVEVVPAPAGKTPQFDGQHGAMIHDRVRQTMLSIYQSDDVPPYLDRTAADLLREGRDHFRRFGLDRSSLVSDGDLVYLFPWSGDVILNTLQSQLLRLGLEVAMESACLSVAKATVDELAAALTSLHEAGPADALALARGLPSLAQEKYHVYLDDELLAADYAAASFDTVATWQRLGEVVARWRAT